MMSMSIGLVLRQLSYASPHSTFPKAALDQGIALERGLDAVPAEDRDQIRRARGNFASVLAHIGFKCLLWRHRRVRALERTAQLTNPPPLPGKRYLGRYTWWAVGGRKRTCLGAAVQLRRLDAIEGGGPDPDFGVPFPACGRSTAVVAQHTHPAAQTSGWKKGVSTFSFH